MDGTASTTDGSQVLPSSGDERHGFGTHAGQRGGDGEEVGDPRLEGHQQGTERKGQEDEAQGEHRENDQRQLGGDLRGQVHVGRGGPADMRGDAVVAGDGGERVVAYHLDEAGFANPRLSAQHDDLSFCLFGAVPTFAE